MALLNLINNAIEYSQENSKVVERAVKSNSHVNLTVEDHGVRIPDHEKKRIFEKFFRGQHGEDQKIRGFGLGLSFVQYIVNSMGGKIDVEDNVPNSTRFTIQLESVEFSD